jgi:hypothetical protein
MTIASKNTLPKFPGFELPYSGKEWLDFKQKARRHSKRWAFAAIKSGWQDLNLRPRDLNAREVVPKQQCQIATMQRP